jgi:hypothetical protein
MSFKENKKKSEKEERLSIEVTLDKNQIEELQHAFPEQTDLQETASKIAWIATSELLGLLSGKKRYLSLSHQYIEWVQNIYELILPEEEYSYRRLYNNFNFPPGTASYISRILRERQNTTVYNKAKNELKRKLLAIVTEYDSLTSAEEKMKKKESFVKLTTNEFSLLGSVIDQIIREDVDVGIPIVKNRTREFVFVLYKIDYIKKIIPEIENI